ncbi:hypothetical protein EST38_g9715 [Candolleomyces aberdarensis]|uniref:Uncharacterized protein n=1 Tax=Candolleomyces aberdarensis TaxID=2316362 RepID=A0A4Q2DC52_9AGAR|nr:hypothetical protein EST38_g9715 [Candolleomyces aberdarensis]
MIAASPMFLCKCLRQCKFPRLQLLNICTEIWLQLTECATFASEGIIAKERWWAILANLLATNECLPSLSAVGLSLNTEILDDFAVVQDDELDAVHRGMANIVAQEIDGLFSDAYTTRGVTVGTTGVLMMMPQYDGIMKDFGFGSGISFH